MEYSSDRSGQHIGDYRLLRRLGAGSFGEVYLAEDLREPRRVALKLLKIPLTDRENLKAFLDEARSFRLTHPGIVPLLDIGMSEQDLPFLVMEYLEGGTLRQRYPKGTRVSLKVVVRMTVQVASALQYAHDRHLIHRDVKPENMLARADGSVLLSDFGLVTVAHASSSVNLYQLYGGTLPYMAPEQYAGQPRATSDQYALAVVVYEWLAGTRPFQGTGPEIALQHLHAPPPSLRNQIPTLPGPVEQVVFQALAKQPEERFARVQDFAEALHAASQPTVAPSPKTSPSPSVLPSPQTESAPSTVSPFSPTVAAPSDWSSSAPDRAVHAVVEVDALSSSPTSPPTSGASLPGEQKTVRSPASHPGFPAEESHSLTTTPPGAPSPVSSRRRFSGRPLLLFLLAALLIGSGSLLGYQAFQNSVVQSQIRATANADVSATSQAQATAGANALGTVQANYATATAEVQATAGVLQTATSDQPTYSDLLTAGQVTDPTWMNDSASCFFAADGYHIHLPPTAPPSNDQSCTESDRFFQDATITVDMVIHNGYSGGLLIRHQSAQFPNLLGYFFEVGIGGNYEIHRINAGSFTTLQDWTDASAINGGLNRLNTLQVIARGNDFLFYVNGVYLTHVQDTVYKVGSLGFVSGTDVTRPGDAVFSNLRVYP